ncbi:hypothetical protein ACFV0T_21315 [Streptomyces sp. NPDC059582]|uniref:hypothetical protein n=1 Tax=Streptomyces sp. NPDC059582 TaxID=3346875 RepID=UPI0036CB3D22
MSDGKRPAADRSGTDTESTGTGPGAETSPGTPGTPEPYKTPEARETSEAHEARELREARETREPAGSVTAGTGTRPATGPDAKRRTTGTAGTAGTAGTTGTTGTTSTNSTAGTASTTGTTSGTSRTGTTTALFPHDESDKLTLRLQQAVTGFVDAPRGSVEEADHVLEEIAARFTDAVAKRRQTLRTSWQSAEHTSGRSPERSAERSAGHSTDGDRTTASGAATDTATDTEQLRLALRDYRELAERLLRA